MGLFYSVTPLRGPGLKALKSILVAKLEAPIEGFQAFMDISSYLLVRANPHVKAVNLRDLCSYVIDEICSLIDGCATVCLVQKIVPALQRHTRSVETIKEFLSRITSSRRSSEATELSNDLLIELDTTVTTSFRIIDSLQSEPG